MFIQNARKWHTMVLNDNLVCVACVSTTSVDRSSSDFGRLIFSVHQFGKEPDVANSDSECVDLGQSFLVRKGRDVSTQPLKRVVNRLHPFPLALICRPSLLHLMLFAFSLPPMTPIYFRLVIGEDNVGVVIGFAVGGADEMVAPGIKPFPVLWSWIIIFVVVGC